MKPHYYRVQLRCEYGPDRGCKRLCDCMVVERNATWARKRIVEFVAEQNKPPRPDDGSELSFDEARHVHESWSRWRVVTLDPCEPFEHPEDRKIYWTNWVEIPAEVQE